MFGYVRPSDDRLTPADRETFRAAYCGLCHALGARYGLVGRMILNYDLTFLAMVLSDGAGEDCMRRCAVHPLRKRCCTAGDPALDAAADMSVILTYWQLRDGVADHGFWGRLKYRIASALLYPAYRRARERRPRFDAGTRHIWRSWRRWNGRDVPLWMRRRTPLHSCWHWRRRRSAIRCGGG